MRQTTFCASVCVYMRQTANTFHILSETIIGKTDTHRGSAEIPSMKIARVNIKRWRKKEVRREGNVQPLPRECQNKRTLPPQGCFQVFKFFDAWRTISDFFFLRCLSPTSQLAGRKASGKLMRRSKKKAHTQTGACRRSGFFDRENRYTYPEILPQTSLPR